VGRAKKDGRLTDHPARRHQGRRAQDSTAKEGHEMNTQFWLELLILALRIVSAGLAG
jgi:hypothetical protein